LVTVKLRNLSSETIKKSVKNKSIPENLIAIPHYGPHTSVNNGGSGFLVEFSSIPDAVLNLNVPHDEIVNAINTGDVVTSIAPTVYLNGHTEWRVFRADIFSSTILSLANAN
jgi:hypothetical protein